MGGQRYQASYLANGGIQIRYFGYQKDVSCVVDRWEPTLLP
jgi:hypothetical protein